MVFVWCSISWRAMTMTKGSRDDQKHFISLMVSGPRFIEFRWNFTAQKWPMLLTSQKSAVARAHLTDNQQKQCQTILLSPHFRLRNVLQRHHIAINPTRYGHFNFNLYFHELLWMRKAFSDVSLLTESHQLGWPSHGKVDESKNS